MHEKRVFDNQYSDSLQQERAQSLVRIIVVSVVLITMSMLSYVGPSALSHAPFHLALVLVASYWFVSLAWLIGVRLARRPSRWRRHLITLLDLSVTSATMSLADTLGAFFYPIYQWIIIGHGVRFGVRALSMATGISAVGFALVIATTPYWQHNLITASGLMIGLFVLPAYFLILLRQLHTLNQRLGVELEKTRHVASHDPLTGLANRHQFYAQMADDIRRARRHNSGFAVLFIDLDGFKTINDELGHHAGDKVLQEIAKRLHQSAREVDLAARLGGDEFAMIIDNIDNEQDVLDPVQRIAHIINQPVAIHNQQRQLSASIGISLYPQHGTDPGSLTSNADLAMYEAKRQGKRRHILFSRTLDKASS